MEALHFVRPMMFFGLIPLIILLIILYRRQGNSVNWKTVCDAKLLPYILSQSTNRSSRFPLFIAALAASLCIIAAAGPAFEKLPKPVYREQSTLVVLMDLSQSMDASDIKPSRMERAKLKLLDILKIRKAGQTALIVYAADAFTVTPLTDDSNTIAHLVPTLETGLMPSQGSHAYTAIDKSLELLQQAGASGGDVLLIADEITNRDLQSINMLTTKGHRLSVLGVGTENGGPISLNGGFLQDSSGAIIIPKLNQQKLQQAALKGGGLYASIQANDSDIEKLNKLFSSRKVKQGNDENSDRMELTADIWQEEGPWLLLLVIPLVALWARKGWLLCFTALILPIPEPAYALDMEHLWRNPDQKAMSLFNAGDAKTAAEKFQQNDWKASAHYRAGNYEKSLEALQEPTTSNDFYNKGNALAQMGRYPEAVAAYDEALNLDANNEDASFNREQVEKVIKEQQQSQDGEGEKSDDSEQDGKENKDQQKQDEQGESSDQKDGEDQQSEDADKKDASESEQKNKDQSESDQDKQSAQQNNQEQDKNKVEQAVKDAQEESQDQADKEEQQAQQMNQLEETELSEDDQAVEQWLKRVPDNPEQLLRRKFLYQYKNMEKKTPSEQSW
ncbi:MAG: VWA domain-containing protein [Gammaproteobacteria bacterium]|nr:VWA domain-containing protein [Gammaproteobacteria bacterium]MCK5262602.1 VWA domain-containing protein [Gammaproteobacteria bacterium]